MEKNTHAACLGAGCKTLFVLFRCDASSASEVIDKSEVKDK